MRTRELQQFKKQLMAMRAELIKSGKLEEEDSQKGDPADLASMDRQRELGIRIRERNRNLRSLIDDALERIEDGEYGECQDCGEQIPVGRLKIRPFATRCVPCQTLRERAGRGAGEGAELLSGEIDVREFQEDKD